MEMPRPNQNVLSKKDALVQRLSTVLPRDAIIHDEAETRAYECDGLSAYRCPPLLAVLPGSTEEVSAVLRICHEMNVPVVPRGAGTSLAGGALPTADCAFPVTLRQALNMANCCSLPWARLLTKTAQQTCSTC